MAAHDTIPHRLLAQAGRAPSSIAYHVKRQGRWQPTTWHTFAAEVRAVARALIALGLAPGGAVAILGFNRPEWVIVDHATMMVGAAAAGIYTTCSPEEVHYIVEHAEAHVVLVEDAGQLAKVQARRAALPRSSLAAGPTCPEGHVPGALRTQAPAALSPAAPRPVPKDSVRSPRAPVRPAVTSRASRAAAPTCGRALGSQRPRSPCDTGGESP